MRALTNLMVDPRAAAQFDEASLRTILDSMSHHLSLRKMPAALEEEDYDRRISGMAKAAAAADDEDDGSGGMVMGGGAVMLHSASDATQFAMSSLGLLVSIVPAKLEMARVFADASGFAVVARLFDAHFKMRVVSSVQLVITLCNRLAQAAPEVYVRNVYEGYFFL